jgi:hypothetical protein
MQSMLPSILGNHVNVFYAMIWAVSYAARDLNYSSPNTTTTAMQNRYIHSMAVYSAMHM